MNRSTYHLYPRVRNLLLSVSEWCDEADDRELRGCACCFLLVSWVVIAVLVFLAVT